MTESIEEQEALRTLKCQRRLHLTAAFLCLAASAVIMVLVFVLFMEDCPGCRSYMAGTLGTLAIVLFIVGLMILSTIVCRKGRHNDLASQVVISLIPAEDLVKSPASLMLFNHQVPRRQPFVENSSIDLPDYFAVVQNIDEFCSSVDAKLWTEDVPETPPPCYKQALEMISVVTAREVDIDSSKQGNTEDTRL